VSPGGAGFTGYLTATNLVTLQGTTSLKLNKAGQTNDVIQAASVNYGGTLVLTNLGGTLANGDSFNLFSASVYAGGFANLLPAIPGAGLAWDTASLVTNGTLRIVLGTTQPPRLGIAWSSAGAVMGGTSTLAGATYYVLASTNLGVPLTNWAVLTTNRFDPGGNFTFTDYGSTNVSLQFYRLQVR
jgi:hypothetical protein